MKHFSLHKELAGNLSIRVATIFLDFHATRAFPWGLLQNFFFVFYEWLLHDVFDETGRLLLEFSVPIHIKTTVNDVREFAIAVLFEVGPFFQDYSFALSINAENVNLILLIRNQIMICFIQLEDDEDAVDVARLLHFLNLELFLVGAQEDVAGLGLVQEDVLEDAEEPPEFERLHLLISELITFQGYVHLLAEGDINIELQVIDPLLIRV